MTKAKAHGSIERINGKPRYIKFGVGDEKGRPRRFPLPKGCSEALAREKMAWLFAGIASGSILVDPLATKKQQKPAPAGSAGETVATYADRWLTHRKARGLSSHDTDTSRMRTHVLPILGALGRWVSPVPAHVTTVLDLTAELPRIPVGRPSTCRSRRSMGQRRIRAPSCSRCARSRTATAPSCSTARRGTAAPRWSPARSWSSAASSPRPRRPRPTCGDTDPGSRSAAISARRSPG